MSKIKFRTLYDTNYNPDVFATDVGIDEDLVQQHMRDECDVNVIMRRYQSTGVLTHVRDEATAIYGDFYDAPDYKTGAELILAADNLFMELPSSVRDHFKNSAGDFVEFAGNPENLEQMREWGLAPKANPETVEALAEPKAGGRTSSPPPSTSSPGET